MDLSRALRVAPGDVVSLVGGGGKSSLMFRLAAELTGQGRKVVTTTTTHIFVHQMSLAPTCVFCQAGRPARKILENLRHELRNHDHVLVVGEIETDTGKAAGIPPGLVDAIAAMPEVDFVINEADGARMRPFKAPDSHEPVVPTSTTQLVPVVGIDVIGCRLTEDCVHRPARVAELAQVQPGVEVDLEVVSRVLCHPQGGLKGLPPHAGTIAFINKVDAENPAELDQARRLAVRLLECPQLSAVAIGSTQQTDPVLQVQNRVAAVLLAAGASSRFGRLKQIEPWGDSTLLGRAADTGLASLAHPLVAVLGNQAGACRRALADRPVTITINPEWQSGQSSSIRAGLAALPSNISAALFLLADQPELKPETINSLIERYQRSLAPVVWPEYLGQRGNPVLFDRELFPRLMELSADVGGRALLHHHTEAAERVDVPDPGILFDIDRPEDYHPN
jgi:molybdenum cofactor cytidylyltransferase